MMFVGEIDEREKGAVKRIGLKDTTENVHLPCGFRSKELIKFRSRWELGIRRKNAFDNEKNSGILPKICGIVTFAHHGVSGNFRMKLSSLRFVHASTKINFPLHQVDDAHHLTFDVGVSSSNGSKFNRKESSCMKSLSCSRDSPKIGFWNLKIRNQI